MFENSDMIPVIGDLILSEFRPRRGFNEHSDTENRLCCSERWYS